MAEEFSIISDSEENTCRMAQKIARLFCPGDLILLDGDLGAGKTYFVKGFSVGFQTGDPVNSPTFSIANFYRSELADLLHIDLYRIETFDEFLDLGLFDYFSQTVTLIEWGIKFADYFDEYLLVSIEIKDDNTRQLTFKSRGDKYQSAIYELEKLLKGEEIC
jgi:tRNA threonylcarbamoyladenosine biosynthesis protein TsaE